MSEPIEQQDEQVIPVPLPDFVIRGQGTYTPPPPAEEGEKQ